MFPQLDKKRAILMAMLHHLDLGVGAVVKKLKDDGLWENTLLFFLTDNGGAKAMNANNGILRGFKGSLYEGGIRTPWVVSWPAKFAGGRTIDAPVISLDILPTAIDAMGTKGVAKRVFDGKSLLPLLMGKSTAHHPVLYWNSGEPKGEWAVRERNWKAHGLKQKYELYDLASDPSEKTDLAAKRPELAKRLAKRHETWLAEMVQSAGKINVTWPRDRATAEEPKPKDAAREKKRAARRKARQRQNKTK
jgi:arylsulfatase A-like enzyme